MLWSRSFALALLLVFFFIGNNAKSQDHSSSPHGVYPLSKFAPGQWVEKVSGDFTIPESILYFGFIRMQDILLCPTRIR